MTLNATPTAALCTDPGLLKLVADYITVHDIPTADGIARLFTPGFTVHGPNQPAEGVGAQGYLAFLQSLQGLSFRQAPGTQLTVDDEGRLILHFVVTRGDQTLAQGVDTITLENGLISKVVGAF